MKKLEIFTFQGLVSTKSVFFLNFRYVCMCVLPIFGLTVELFNLEVLTKN